jgi:heme A synthase
VIRAGQVLLGWSALIGTWTVMLGIWSGDEVPVALFGAATLTMATLGVAVLVLGRRRSAPEESERVGEVRAVPDLSLGTFALAAGLTAMALGAVFGLFMVLMGAGLALAGAGRLASERRAERRGEPPPS